MPFVAGRIVKVTTVSARRAFTLIELLVVLAIISLLIAMVMPTLGSARRNAERTTCAAHLRDVGVALRSYLDSNNDKLPYASFMPSVTPIPLDIHSEPIYISKVLSTDVVGQQEVFKCPGDKTDNDRPDPNRGKSYFQSEGSSYNYRTQLGGWTIEEWISARADHHGKVPQNTIWIFRDYDNFHGPSGKPGSRRYLFIDGHVTDFELE
jgi:prepilin-type N-terminal cleavage/methylation domain-containing protein